MSRALSLADIIEQLPDLPVGTRIQIEDGDKIYVGIEDDDFGINEKCLRWLDDGHYIRVNKTLSESTYHLIPDYVEISWQEAFEIICEATQPIKGMHTGVYIEGDDGFQEITPIDDFEEDLDIEDFIDLFRMTFYKSNK